MEQVQSFLSSLYCSSYNKFLHVWDISLPIHVQILGPSYKECGDLLMNRVCETANEHWGQVEAENQEDLIREFSMNISKWKLAVPDDEAQKRLMVEKFWTRPLKTLQEVVELHSRDQDGKGFLIRHPEIRHAFHSNGPFLVYV